MLGRCSKVKKGRFDHIMAWHDGTHLWHTASTIKLPIFMLCGQAGPVETNAPGTKDVVCYLLSEKRRELSYDTF